MSEDVDNIGTIQSFNWWFHTTRPLEIVEDMELKGSDVTIVGKDVVEVIVDDVDVDVDVDVVVAVVVEVVVVGT